MDVATCRYSSALPSPHRRAWRCASAVFGAVAFLIVAAVSLRLAPAFFVHGSAVRRTLRGGPVRTLGGHSLADGALVTAHDVLSERGISKSAASLLFAASLVSVHSALRTGIVEERIVGVRGRAYRNVVARGMRNGADACTAGHVPDANGSASRMGRFRQWLRKAPRKRISRQALQKYGFGMVLSYGFVTNVSSIFIIAAVWLLYTRRAGASPLTLRPLRLNPKFLALYGAVYLSLGNVIRPLRFLAALGLAPAFDGLLNLLEERLRLPRWLSAGILSGMLALLSIAMLVTAVSVSSFVAQIRM